MALIDQLAIAYFKVLAKRLENSAYDPQPWQEQSLKQLLVRNRSSQMAQVTGFAKVKTPIDMRDLPVTEYTNIKDFVDTVSTGGARESRLFGKSQVVSMAMTSGTTSDPKRVPINQDYVSAYRRFTLGVNAAYIARTNDKNFFRPNAKTLLLTARPHVGTTQGGLSEGFISGFMASQTPIYYRNKILPSRDVLHIPTWDEKIDAILDEAKDKNVQTIATIPPLALSLTERALKKFGVATLREVWPNLSGLLFSGVALTAANKEKFNSLWGATSNDPLIFWEMYAATEAQIGHSFDPSWKGMVFNPFDNFYQFLENGIGAPLQMQELEVGKRYVILATTPGGLVNYRTGDWVDILSVKPLTFRVAGRDKEEISLVGEKLNVLHFHQAIGEISQRLGVHIHDFVVWPMPGDPHWLSVGVDATAIPPNLAHIFDEALEGVNPGYKELRKIMNLYGPLQLKAMSSEIFANYHARNLHRGQFKPKRLFKNEEDFHLEYFGPKSHSIGAPLRH